MSKDLERGSVSAATKPVQQYGATDPVSETDEKLPLFLGRWDVQPNTFYKIFLAAYVGWFVLYRLADIAYILTIHCRFPAGLGHLYYPSEGERLASVSYTREGLICIMLHRTCIFIAVVTIFVSGGFAGFDAVLRRWLSNLSSWWESSFIRAFFGRCYDCCCTPIWKGCSVCCSPVGRCLEPCMSWCSKLKDHIYGGRLSSEISSRFGFRLTCRELLFGSLYLTLFSVFFLMISAPFVYWSSMMDVRYGFSNPLTVSAASIRKKIFDGFVSELLFGWIRYFFILALLQYRRGWLIGFVAFMTLLIWVQFNIEVIAPHILDMNNAFPRDNFAVGRGFPWVRTDSEKNPWVSLNRLYFKDPTFGSEEQSHFSTRDKSKGQLRLTHDSTGTWTIAHADASQPVYAETISAVANHVLDGLRTKAWTVGDADTRIGVRSGSRLRDKLYGFARAHKIGIAEVYIVDGSHKDIRANAFVAGAGNNSVVGLFDTLFLGQRSSDSDDTDSMSMLKLAMDDSAIKRASEIVQDVDTEENDRDRRVPRNSAPTQAMSDNEIVAIMAHELGHARLKHLEQGMVLQAITQFFTWAAMGWMVLSPLAAAALSLHAPLLHVGACVWDHVVGPPLEGIMSLISDELTRHNEYEADAFAARTSKDYASALQSSLAKLTVNANQDPSVPLFYELLHHDHPAFVRRWAHIENVKQETYGQ